MKCTSIIPKPSPHHPSPWESCLPRNRSLVPKRLAPTKSSGFQIGHLPPWAWRLQDLEDSTRLRARKVTHDQLGGAGMALSTYYVPATGSLNLP